MNPRMLAGLGLLWTLWSPAWADEYTHPGLDVSLVVFDHPGTEEPNKTPETAQRIREAEARYIPFVLRSFLEQSDQWGAVRVLPDPDPTAELLLTGTVVEATGLHLEVQLSVRDATGRIWLDQNYTASSEASDFTRSSGAAPLFASLYRQISADLGALGTALTDADVDQVRQVSWLRYANALAPDSFADYLAPTPDDGWVALRLPAHNDPMKERIDRIRAYEYLFIDTVDEQYASLYDDMTPAYDSWRQYDREQRIYEDAYRARIEQRDRPRRGSFEALKQVYDNYKWSKIQEQESALLSATLVKEIEPTVIAVEGSVVRLEGSLGDRYQQWRTILARIHQLENGTPAQSLR